MICGGSSRFRTKVAVERQTASKDAVGGTTLTWAKLRDWSVEFLTVTGAEVVEAGGVTAYATHKLNGPWFSGLTPRDRITRGARTFEIVSVGNVNERNQLYHVICKEDV